MSMLDGKVSGIVIPGPVVNLAGAGTANAAVIFAIPTSANLLGTKTLVPKRVRWSDNATGGTYLHIGTGVGGAFADLIPAIRTVNNMDGELELPNVEAAVSITAYPIAVNGGSIDIQLEADIKG